MPPSSSLTVGEVARRSAVSTIHFYERQGLIEGWRTAGNQRRYFRAVLRRIAVIRIAQKAGVPLKIMKAYLEAMPSGAGPSSKDWQSLAQSWQIMLDARIEALRQLRDELEGCIGCGCLSLTDCPLRNAGDKLGRDGAGPRLLAGDHLAPEEE